MTQAGFLAAWQAVNRAQARGCTDQHSRDNHVNYMLRNAQGNGDIHTFAIVFSPGGSHRTSITTDGGRVARFSGQYVARGGATLK